MSSGLNANLNPAQGVARQQRVPPPPPPASPKFCVDAGTPRQLPVQISGEQILLSETVRNHTRVVKRHEVGRGNLHDVGRSRRRRAWLFDVENSSLAGSAQATVLILGRARIDAVDDPPLERVLILELVLTLSRTCYEEGQRAGDRPSKSELGSVEVRTPRIRHLVGEQLQRARHPWTARARDEAHHARLGLTELGREGTDVHVHLLERVGRKENVVGHTPAERANVHAIDKHGFLVGSAATDRKPTVGLHDTRGQQHDVRRVVQRELVDG